LSYLYVTLCTCHAHLHSFPTRRSSDLPPRPVPVATAHLPTHGGLRRTPGHDRTIRRTRRPGRHLLDREPDLRGDLAPDRIPSNSAGHRAPARRAPPLTARRATRPRDPRHAHRWPPAASSRRIVATEPDGSTPNPTCRFATTPLSSRIVITLVWAKSCSPTRRYFTPRSAASSRAVASGAVRSVQRSGSSPTPPAKARSLSGVSRSGSIETRTNPTRSRSSGVSPASIRIMSPRIRGHACAQYVYTSATTWTRPPRVPSVRWTPCWSVQTASR